MINAGEIRSCHGKIKDHIFNTPLEFSPELSRISGANAYLKLDNMQLTGSFKIRGVMNKILGMGPIDFKRPFVAASTGNHAAAFGYAAKKFGFAGTLFLPEKTSDAKVKALNQYPIEKRFYGKNSMETEVRASEYAKEINGILIHPYNDPDIIKGQGTIAVEIEKQLPKVHKILVPIGGGGLISGIASYFSTNESVDVIGCQPVNASEMYDSVNAGCVVKPSDKSTISDATAGGIEEDATTFHICKQLVKEYELIEEEEIKKALAFIVKHSHILIEPACALTIAPLLFSTRYKGKNVVCVLTGKKINNDLLISILNEYGNHY